LLALEAANIAVGVNQRIWAPAATRKRIAFVRDHLMNSHFGLATPAAVFFFSDSRPQKKDGRIERWI
jgi:hypothetical protein